MPNDVKMMILIGIHVLSGKPSLANSTRMTPMPMMVKTSLRPGFVRCESNNATVAPRTTARRRENSMVVGAY